MCNNTKLIKSQVHDEFEVILVALPCIILHDFTAASILNTPCAPHTADAISHSARKHCHKHLCSDSGLLCIMICMISFSFWWGGVEFCFLGHTLGAQGLPALCLGTKISTSRDVLKTLNYILWFMICSVCTINNFFCLFRNRIVYLH